jgi:hypothetical protein
VCVGETGRIIETCDTYAWVSQRSLLWLSTDLKQWTPPV